MVVDSNDVLNDYALRLGWEEDFKGFIKYISLVSLGNSFRWSFRLAGKLVSIRR